MCLFLSVKQRSTLLLAVAWLWGSDLQVQRIIKLSTVWYDVLLYYIFCHTNTNACIFISPNKMHQTMLHWIIEQCNGKILLVACEKPNKCSHGWRINLFVLHVGLVFFGTFLEHPYSGLVTSALVRASNNGGQTCWGLSCDISLTGDLPFPPQTMLNFEQNVRICFA